MHRSALPSTRLRRAVLLLLLCFAAGLSCAAQPQPTITGELRVWHKVTVTFDGPRASEDGSPNPFRDYRLNVTFTHAAGGQRYVAPGFFAAAFLGTRSTAATPTSITGP